MEIVWDDHFEMWFEMQVPFYDYVTEPCEAIPEITRYLDALENGEI